MENVVYMKMFYYPCNNKSLADAAGRRIVIHDFGEKRVCGKRLIQTEHTVLAQLPLAGTELEVRSMV